MNYNGHKILFAVFLLLFSLSSASYAQVVHGMSEATHFRLGGNNYIVGMVFWPNGRPVDRRMRIRLVTPTQGEFVETTDTSGQFIFGGLPKGLYSIVIDREDDFESTQQTVEILLSNESPKRSYPVTIRLRDKVEPVMSTKPVVINAAEKSVPKSAMDFYRKALGLSATKDYKSAIEQLELAIAEYPQFLDAFNEMGVQYMRLNELEKALESMEKALKIKSDAFEPNLNKGILLVRMKRYDEAASVLRGAIGIKEISALAHYYLGRSLIELEHFTEAEKALNTALTLSQNDMNEAHRMLAKLFMAKGEDDRAINELETYLKLVPTASDAGRLREIIQQLKSRVK